MVDPYRVISERIVDLVDRVSDDCAPEVADVERLCDVRRRVLDDDLLSGADVGVSELFALREGFAYYVLRHLFSGDEHVEVSVHRLDLFEHLFRADLLSDLLSDERRRLSEHLRELEARECKVSHLFIGRHFDHGADLFRLHIRRLCDDLSYLHFVVYHFLFLSRYDLLSVTTVTPSPPWS